MNQRQWLLEGKQPTTSNAQSSNYSHSLGVPHHTLPNPSIPGWAMTYRSSHQTSLCPLGTHGESCTALQEIRRQIMFSSDHPELDNPQFFQCWHLCPLSSPVLAYSEQGSFDWSSDNAVLWMEFVSVPHSNLTPSSTCDNSNPRWPQVLEMPSQGLPLS